MKSFQLRTAPETAFLGPDTAGKEVMPQTRSIALLSILLLCRSLLTTQRRIPLIADDNGEWTVQQPQRHDCQLKYGGD